MPMQHNLCWISAQALGYITTTILIKKNAAKACANTTHGIHIAGIDPPPSALAVMLVATGMAAAVACLRLFDC